MMTSAGDLATLTYMYLVRVLLRLGLASIAVAGWLATTACVHKPKVEKVKDSDEAPEFPASLLKCGGFHYPAEAYKHQRDFFFTTPQLFQLSDFWYDPKGRTITADILLLSLDLGKVAPKESYKLKFTIDSRSGHFEGDDLAHFQGKGEYRRPNTPREKLTGLKVVDSKSELGIVLYGINQKKNNIILGQRCEFNEPLMNRLLRKSNLIPIQKSEGP